MEEDTNSEKQFLHTSSEPDSTYKLINKIISVFAVIIFLFIIILVGLIIISVISIMGSGASGELGLILFDKFEPLIEIALNSVSVVLILLVALMGVKWLIMSPSSKLDISKVVSDLPSLLAIIVIGTISILSVARLGIPDVLSNIALVIVGFYFGKAKERADKTSETTPKE